MRNFPNPKFLIVDKKGKITFTPDQWKWLLELAGCKSKSFKVQHKTIEKLVISAVKAALKKK